ncbi:glycosyltransferase family 2 protein [Paenibacillus albus]|uniref:Glycosyltransferase n=1 Tax=Paenibacillus albus TaxID=2495582 RepID=A0A3S8ZYC8_9BACL|nr:glycosyltransferase family 2 protein [Paenibacillus albus]AZN38503.1 glycosyltransferase [Paenibacillus albus]
MRDYPKISVITATFNSEKFVEIAVKSLIAQTYPNIEYIIVDGASEDRTLEVIERYRKHIDIVISEPDNGVYDAFNKGIKVASGDIIYFLNSDDYLADERVISDVAILFSEQPYLKIIYGNVVVHDIGNYNQVIGKKLTLSDFKEGQMCPHQGVFVKKELFESHGYFRTDIWGVGDFDFMIRCFQSDERNALYYNRIIAYYRLMGESGDPINTNRLQAMKMTVIKQHFGELVQDYEKQLDVNGYYRLWLDRLLLTGNGITSGLSLRLSNKKIAIYGTMKTAQYLIEDCKRNGIEVVVLLDGNPNMQSQIVRDVQVVQPSWIMGHRDQVDAIVLSQESPISENKVREKLAELTVDPNMIYSWRELVRLQESYSH